MRIMLMAMKIPSFFYLMVVDADMIFIHSSAFLIMMEIEN